MFAMVSNFRRGPLAVDLLAVSLLVGFDVVMRLLPHAPNFTPFAASALFAASVLRVRALSVIVPTAAMVLSDAMLGFYDWRVSAAVYACLALPAGAAALSNRLRQARLIVPLLLSSSLIFFLVTNLAVWAFSPLYAADVGGLIKCYIAALPFLQNTIAGDLFFGLMLFGGFEAVRQLRTRWAGTPDANAGLVLGG